MKAYQTGFILFINVPLFSQGYVNVMASGQSNGKEPPDLTLPAMTGGKKSGPSGNRTRVLGSEAQEDVLYPMDPEEALGGQHIKHFLRK